MGKKVSKPWKEFVQEVPEFVPDTAINDEHTDEELEFIEHDFNAKDDNPNIPKLNQKDGITSGLNRIHNWSAFKSSHIVPWKLRNRWFNCLEMVKFMHFRVTHIYREGNCCADRMAALGITVNGFYWWDIVPPSVKGDYINNLMGLPSFRFH
ncbi:hypothetical protein TSUD_399970 [Trifolium subterraneum]|uniref:RNase H type-1 domain-containing protein n=1 Tax=Trifolium subterraneum TaxID=3900 RepID=A0A2Z6NJZ6_TRISU|nr:hypothetical protein TSUD_399970 [Trifolium subterraneum]